ncbi:hypothetical protein Leryth_022981 [Lithospermum erythrorhizon]|nr:hypothetical protein Leryth_022981 [Lithospermum erythrorhizon]
MDAVNVTLTSLVGNKGFICQHCGLLRDTEEIRTTVTDIKLITEKASKSLSSGNLYDAASLYKQVERLQIRSYHLFSIILMRTRESLLKVHVKLEISLISSRSRYYAQDSRLINMLLRDRNNVALPTFHGLR